MNHTVVASLKPHALVLGTGIGARVHIPALARSLGAAQVGLISGRPENARREVGQQLGYVSNTLAAGLEDWKPSIVTLGVPTSSHLAIAEELRGFAGTVLLEKPVGMSLEQCQAIRQALTHATCYVNYQLRGLSAFRAMRHTIQSGRIGRPALITIEERSAAFLNASAETWHFRPALGGGQRLAMLTHLVDLARFLLGGHDCHIDRCEPSVLPRRSGDVEHSVSCQFQLQSAAVQVSSSSASRGPRRFRVEVIGAEGEIHFAFSDGTGQCVHVDGRGTEQVWSHSGSEMSLFRVAFPEYLAYVLATISAQDPEYTPVGLGEGGKGVLATIEDALIVHSALKV